VHAATSLLWLLIALAAAGGFRALVWPGRPVPPAPAAAEAGGFAEMFVAAFLEAGAGQEQSLHAFYPGPVDLRDVTPGSRYASRTSVVASEAVGPGYRAVTVGAEVLVLASGGYLRAGVHYYRVGVSLGARGPVATSLPAEVAAPATGPLPRLVAPPLAAPGDDGVALAVRRFLDADLAGHGELDPTAAPGSSLVAVTPPPFVSVALVGIAVGPAAPGGTRLVLAEVVGTDAGGLKQVLDYSLRMADLRGRWVVEQVLPAPPLKP
jgi:hypothetical protein